MYFIYVRWVHRSFVFFFRLDLCVIAKMVNELEIWCVCVHALVSEEKSKNKIKKHNFRRDDDITCYAFISLFLHSKTLNRIAYCLLMIQSQRKWNGLSGIKFWIDRVVEIATVTFVWMLSTLLRLTSTISPFAIAIQNWKWKKNLDISLDINVSRIRNTLVSAK